MGRLTMKPKGRLTMKPRKKTTAIIVAESDTRIGSLEGAMTTPDATPVNDNKTTQHRKIGRVSNDARPRLNKGYDEPQTRQVTGYGGPSTRQVTGDDGPSNTSNHPERRGEVHHERTRDVEQ